MDIYSHVLPDMRAKVALAIDAAFMTLFAHAATENQVFETALTKYFPGGYDQLTLDRL